MHLWAPILYVWARHLKNISNCRAKSNSVLRTAFRLLAQLTEAVLLLLSRDWKRIQAWKGSSTGCRLKFWWLPSEFYAFCSSPTASQKHFKSFKSMHLRIVFIGKAHHGYMSRSNLSGNISGAHEDKAFSQVCMQLTQRIATVFQHYSPSLVRHLLSV